MAAHFVSRSFNDERNILYTWTTNQRGAQKHGPFAEVITGLQEQRHTKIVSNTKKAVTQAMIIATDRI